MACRHLIFLGAATAFLAIGCDKRSTEAEQTPPASTRPTSSPSFPGASQIAAGPQITATPKSAGASRAIDELSASYRSRYNAKLKAIEAQPEYIALKNNVAAFDSKLVGDVSPAQRASVANAKMQASSELRRYTEQKLAEDPTLEIDKKRIASMRVELAQLQASEAIEAKRRGDEQAKRYAEAAAREARRSQPITRLGVGAEGILPEACSITQIIDARHCIIDYEGVGIWLEGFSTAGKVDGSTINIPHPIRISGTKSYITVLGAQRTVFVAEPLN
jgi:hypothetical protein